MNTETNGKRLEDFAPHALCEEVQMHQAQDGGNAHVISRSLALHRAPPDLLPPAVKKERLRRDNAEAALARAEAALQERSRAWQDYNTKVSTLVLEKKTLQAQEDLLQRSKNDVDSFEQDLLMFANSLRTTHEATFMPRVNRVALAREYVAHLPEAIRLQKITIEALEYELNELEKLYGENAS